MHNERPPSPYLNQRRSREKIGALRDNSPKPITGFFVSFFFFFSFLFFSFDSLPIFSVEVLEFYFWNLSDFDRIQWASPIAIK